MKKYLIIALAAFVLETASTMYIATVASRDIMMVFWGLIGPFLGLPFIGYMVESKTWKERLKMATTSGIGYGLGSLVVYLYSVS